MTAAVMALAMVEMMALMTAGMSESDWVCKTVFEWALESDFGTGEVTARRLALAKAVEMVDTLDVM
jgi:hypothetical protein